MSVIQNIAAGSSHAVTPDPVSRGAGLDASSEIQRPDRVGAVLRYLRRNPSMIVGLLMLLSLALFSGIGSLFMDEQRIRPLSVMAIQPPSWDLPFGSDRQGRDLLAVMIYGTPLTIRIGLIAGFIGVG